MKIVSILLLSAFFCAPALAQQITQPADSVPGLLCKKWIASYTQMGEMKIAPQAGVPVPVFEFKKDKTVLFSGGSDAPTRGTWAYNPQKKCVNVTVGGHPRGKVVQLQSDQLVMLIDTKDATPDDPTPITMVFKVKSR